MKNPGPLRIFLISVLSFFILSITWANGEVYKICDRFNNFDVQIGQSDQKKIKPLQVWGENEERFHYPLCYFSPGEPVDIMMFCEVRCEALLNWNMKVVFPDGSVRHYGFPNDWWRFKPGLYCIGIGTYFYEPGLYRAKLMIWVEGEKALAEKIKTKFRILPE